MKTNGKGLWSNVSKSVECTSVVLRYVSKAKDFGELRVYFNTKSWDTNKDGLIYTDPLFIKELRDCLQTFGFSLDAARDVDYSEQGMQGEDYVSLDVGKILIKEWHNLFNDGDELVLIK